MKINEIKNSKRYYETDIVENEVNKALKNLYWDNRCDALECAAFTSIEEVRQTTIKNIQTRISIPISDAEKMFDELFDEASDKYIEHQKSRWLIRCSEPNNDQIHDGDISKVFNKYRLFLKGIDLSYESTIHKLATEMCFLYLSWHSLSIVDNAELYNKFYDKIMDFRNENQF